MAEKIGLWIPLVSSNISNMAGKCPQKIAWMSKKNIIELNGGFSSMLDETRGVHLCLVPCKKTVYYSKRMPKSVVPQR